jgi:hypothetical protein
MNPVDELRKLTDLQEKVNSIYVTTQKRHSASDELIQDRLSKVANLHSFSFSLDSHEDRQADELQQRYRETEKQVEVFLNSCRRLISELDQKISVLRQNF